MNTKRNGNSEQDVGVMDVDVDASSSIAENKSSKRMHTDEEETNSTVINDLMKKRRRSSGSVSQELRCPICLAEKDDTTMLSECKHVFCYACIIEWLKMKPECPLCKRLPKQFKHKFQSNAGEKLTWETPGQLEDVTAVRAAVEMESILAVSSYTADVERHAVMQVIQRLEEEVRMLQHMVTRSYSRTAAYKATIKATQDELLAYQNLADMFGICSRREIFRELAFRRVIYLRNLSPRSIVAPHFAVVFNAEYVRANEAAVRLQLMPYILREFAAVTYQSSVDVDALMNAVFDYLTSRASRMHAVEFLQQCGVRHPHHFLNNLSHFAGTGQSLDVYDQNSEYTPRSSHVLPYMSGNDDILVINSAINNDVQVVGESSVPSRNFHPRTTETSQQMIERFSRRLAEIRRQIRENDAPQGRPRRVRRNAAEADPYDFATSVDFSRGRRARVNTRTGSSASSVVVNIGDSSSDSLEDADDNSRDVILEESTRETARRDGSDDDVATIE